MSDSNARYDLIDKGFNPVVFTNATCGYLVDLGRKENRTIRTVLKDVMVGLNM